ncbi:VPS10 domain-containing receptor SorCS3-like isoform X2 [Tubulanus polymorphus]
MKRQQLHFVPDNIKFHPTKENWLLSYSTFEQSLYLSTDLGETWNLVHDNVGPRFYWAIIGIDKDIRTIHMQVLDIKTGKFRYKACIAEPACKDVTMEDYVGDEDVMSLHVDGKYIFVEKTVSGKTALFVSYNRHAFKQAMFGPDVKPQAYSLLTTAKDQVFIAVLEKWTDASIYISDRSGQYFTKSLDNVQTLFSSLGAEVDFYEVDSMEGVFIANHRNKDSIHFYSVITFDNGGNWTRIPVPKVDHTGKPITCEDCSLNLHLEYSTYAYRIPRIISEKEAPGIILANGMIGKNLSSASDLFLSTDGGLTWTMQLKGSYYTKIVDQGGAIIAISENPYAIVPQCSVMYTCDEGKTWENHTFSKKPVIVDGILTEPGLTSLIVTVYGHESSLADWNLIKLDFKSLLTKKCANSDYITWFPKDKDEDPCILGLNYTYVRRKPDAYCFNGPDYQTKITKQKCDCTERDFECDFGYRSVGNQCQLETWFHPNKPDINCPENSNYTKTNHFGKRKVVADQCEPNDATDKYKPDERPCPILKPDQINVLTKKLDQVIFRTNEVVEFYMTQFLGSKASTNYTWDFGDGTSPVVKIGFLKGSTVNHTYIKGGDFSVKMTASNEAGSNTACINVNIFDAILELDTDVPHGVVANRSFLLYSTALPVNGSHGHVFYAWTFGDEKKKPPMLTFKTSVEHTYRKAGTYTTTVEAFNTVSRFIRKFTVHVYPTSEDFLIVHLGFDKHLDLMKIDTEEWRLFFGNLLKNKLLATLSMSKDLTLDVIVNKGIPTTADVEIYASTSQAEKSFKFQIKELGNALVRKVNTSHMMIDFVNGYAVQIRNAKIDVPVPKPTPGLPPRGSSGYAAIYICVPILLAAIFVSALVVIHYKRKFRNVHRYAMMRSRPQADSLLNDMDNDLDDDDPPLDPNPSILNDDSDDDPLVGEPTLVMMTGAEVVNDEQRNQVNV